MQRLHDHLFLAFVSGFLAILLLSPVFSWLRIVPPARYETSVNFSSVNNENIFAHATIYFWGQTECLDEIFPQATKDATGKMTIDEVMKPETEFLFFREKVRLELTLLLNSRPLCKDTEVPGVAFFYNNIAVVWQ